MSASHDEYLVMAFAMSELSAVTERAEVQGVCMLCLYHALAGLLTETIMLSEGMTETEVIKRKELLCNIMQASNEVTSVSAPATSTGRPE